MGRQFFNTLLTFLWLVAIMGVVQGILTAALGTSIIELGALPYWMLVTIVANAVLIIILTRYLLIKKYLVACAVSIVSGCIAELYLVVLYVFISTRQMAQALLFTQLLSLMMGAVFAGTLIWSRAGERRWIRYTGIAMLASALFAGLLITGMFVSPDPSIKLLLQKILQWSSIFVNGIPALLIPNFRDERNRAEVEISDRPFEKLSTPLMLIGGLCCSIALATGLMLSTQTLSKLSWDGKIASQAEGWSAQFIPANFVDSKGRNLRYQMIPPLDFDTTKRYPVVICLPYGGGIDGAPAAQLLLSDANRKLYQCFIFVPHCPEGEGWGGIPNYPTIDTSVFETIDDLKSRISQIDTKRIYVTGVSRGGYGTWHFVSTNPSMFAAAVPVCGGGDPHLAANIKGVSVWAFHGADDVNVPVTRSREMVAAMKRDGQDPHYTEFPDEAHNIWNNVVATPGWLTWMFDQHRE